jgi:hypothetical protein
VKSLVWSLAWFGVVCEFWGFVLFVCFWKVDRGPWDGMGGIVRSGGDALSIGEASLWNFRDAGGDGVVEGWYCVMFVSVGCWWI